VTVPEIAQVLRALARSLYTFCIGGEVWQRLSKFAIATIASKPSMIWTRLWLVPDSRPQLSLDLAPSEKWTCSQMVSLARQNPCSGFLWWSQDLARLSKIRFSMTKYWIYWNRMRRAIWLCDTRPALHCSEDWRRVMKAVDQSHVKVWGADWLASLEWVPGDERRIRANSDYDLVWLFVECQGPGIWLICTTGMSPLWGEGDMCG
jgi:hypothetical protein